MAGEIRRRRRRTRAGIPPTERNRPKWQLAIEMLDELRGWGLVAPVICADAGYGDNAHFRAALAERGLGYIVQVKGTCTAHAADAAPNCPPSAAAGRAACRATAPNRSRCGSTYWRPAAPAPAACPGAKVPKANWRPSSSRCASARPTAGPATPMTAPGRGLADRPMARR